MQTSFTSLRTEWTITRAAVTELAASDYLDALVRYDDPVRWEAPAGFVQRAALERFLAFRLELEERSGHRIDYELAGALGEASFHAEIYLRDGSLRFSNFGGMLAFTSSSVRARGPVADLCCAMASEHGYHVIPSELLGLAYRGRNPRLSRTSTWFDRFFDVAPL